MRCFILCTNRNWKKDLRCPLEYGLKIFGGKWKTRVVCLLSEAQTLRYSALRNKMVPITDAVLASTLKELIADQIVKRQSFDEIPPRVGYSPHGERASPPFPCSTVSATGLPPITRNLLFAVPGVPYQPVTSGEPPRSTVTLPSPRGDTDQEKERFQGFYFTDISC